MEELTRRFAPPLLTCLAAGGSTGAAESRKAPVSDHRLRVIDR